MRQQTRSVEDGPGCGEQIRDGSGMPQLGQLCAGLRVSALRPVTEREQRLPAAGLGAPSSDVDDLVGCQIRPLARLRRLGERAVVADIPTQLGQRDEDFPGIADDVAKPGISQGRGPAHELGQLGCPHEIQCGGSWRSHIRPDVHSCVSAPSQPLISRRDATRSPPHRPYPCRRTACPLKSSYQLSRKPRSCARNRSPGVCVAGGGQS